MGPFIGPCHPPRLALRSPPFAFGLQPVLAPCQAGAGDYHGRALTAANVQPHGFVHLASLLSTDRIVPEMAARSRRDAIDELVGHLSAGRQLAEDDRAAVLTALHTREETISTGIGSGVAIPHAFSDRMSRVLAVMGRSRGGIDFSAHDDAPVHLVILFIVPRRQYDLHLRTLAAIGRLFNDEEMKRRLLSAATADEMLHMLRRRGSRTIAA